MNRLAIHHPETGEKAEVNRDAYITAKLKDLKEFGYVSLSRETVVSFHLAKGVHIQTRKER